MKRIIAFMALCTLLIMSVFGIHATETAGQMEIIHNQQNSASSTVVYGIDEEYILTLPAEVNMKLGEPKTETVSLTSVYMPLTKRLSVDMASGNYDNAKTSWYVVLDTDSSVKIPYSVKKAADSSVVASTNVILTCDGGDNEESVDLVFNVEADPVQSGSYLDTLTFSVSIIDIT